MENVLDFERILALSFKACKFMEHRYKVDLCLAEEKALDVWTEHKDEILKLADYSIISKNEAEKSVYFLFKDHIRVAIGCYQTKTKDGKKMWFSPFINEIVYDTNLDEADGLQEFDCDVRKEMFYEHRDDFNLTKDELVFIDLVFSGYSPTNHVDVLVFKEALGTESSGYIKTFFNRLCKKLDTESQRIGLK